MSRSSGGSSKLAVELWIYNLGLSSDRHLIFEEEEEKREPMGEPFELVLFFFIKSFTFRVAALRLDTFTASLFFLRPRNARETNRELEKIKTNQAPKEKKKRLKLFLS